MSLTVLLSEVHGVVQRFPASIAGLREIFARAALPEVGGEVVAVLAERVAVDAGFREELYGAVSKAFESEPQLSQLEMLSILVVAAVGPEQTERLAAMDGIDLPLRALFSFVLECRRRQREAAESAPEGARERGVTAHAQPEGPRVLDQGRAPAGVRSPVTASSPGDSAMLARALALAADEPVPAAAEAVRPAPVKHTLPVEEMPVRRVRPVRETLPVAPAVSSKLAEDDDEPVGAPRRWGLLTGVACGVLLGFGLGAFLRFDHRPGPVAVPLTGAAATQGANAVSGGKVKSIDELQAEIAALDSVASVSPSEEARDGVRERAASLRRSSRTRGNGAEREPAAGPRARGAAWAADRPEPGPGKPVAEATVAGGAYVSGANRNAAPPVTTKPAERKGAEMAHLPRVTTGSAGIMAANLVSSPAPAYPEAATAAGVQGEVVVEAVVGRDGGVVDTRVVSGPPLLRAAALDAVQRWHYRPYEVDGKTIEIATTARLEFRLDQ